MVNKLLNIRDELSKTFLLKNLKETTWKQYLKEEIAYVNGMLYIAENILPEYFNQTLKKFSYELSESDSLNVNYMIYINGNIASEQVDNIRILLGDTIKNYPKILSENEIIIKIPTTGSEGLMKIYIPSYSNSSEGKYYQGLPSISHQVRNQSVSRFSFTLGNNSLTLTVNGDFVENQKVELSTLFRDGSTNFVSYKKLTNDETNTFQITVSKGNQDTGFRLKINPYNTFHNLLYTGDIKEVQNVFH